MNHIYKTIGLDSKTLCGIQDAQAYRITSVELLVNNKLSDNIDPAFGSLKEDCKSCLLLYDLGKY